MTVDKNDMKQLENQYIKRQEHIKKWSVLITP